MARPHLKKIFPVVPNGASFLKEIYGVRDDEMELLPLGADLHLFTRLRQSGIREKLRASLDITPDQTLIFTGGKLAREKRTDLLLKAVADRWRDLKLAVAMAGAMPADDAAYASVLTDLGASGAPIHYLGWLDREEVFGWMLASDVAVFPASQSVLWQQAIAAGLPLIVGDAGNQDPSYLNVHNNMIILTGDEISVDGIAAALDTVAADPDRRASMAEGALAVGIELLDWDRIAARTLEFAAPRVERFRDPNR
jgi:glycosyltransferase involved in cell wall biosynthesis